MFIPLNRAKKKVMASSKIKMKVSWQSDHVLVSFLSSRAYGTSEYETRATDCTLLDWGTVLLDGTFETVQEASWPTAGA